MISAIIICLSALVMQGTFYCIFDLARQVVNIYCILFGSLISFIETFFLGWVLRFIVNL